MTHPTRKEIIEASAKAICDDITPDAGEDRWKCYHSAAQAALDAALPIIVREVEKLFLPKDSIEWWSASIGQCIDIIKRMGAE